MKSREYSAIAALCIAAALAFLSFVQSDELSTNMLILIAQFLMYSLTLYGFGEIAHKLFKAINNEHKKRK